MIHAARAGGGAASQRGLGLDPSAWQQAWPWGDGPMKWWGYRPDGVASGESEGTV